jgi:hypothetical protein
LGNDRITATAHNGGYIQLYDWSRGGKAVNHWGPDDNNFAGGFKFVDVDRDAFSTRWSGLPANARQRRVFGMGYLLKETTRGDLTIVERIEAPPGDDPVLLSATVLQNHGAQPIDATVVEYWDVNLHQLPLALMMTYGLRKWVQEGRELLNLLFSMDSYFDENTQTLGIEYHNRVAWLSPAADESAAIDYYPQTTFLAALDDAPPGELNWAVDQKLFFGDDAPDAPPPGLYGAADGRPIAGRSAYKGPALLAFRRRVTVDPGAAVTLRYLYGYAPRREIPALVERHRAPQPLRRPALAEFAAPDAPWLGRELQWHSYYLQAGSLWQDYYGRHFIDQGSAYSYLQGLSGAHRDYALYILPLIYLRPELAREALCSSLQAQDAETGALPYAHHGYGDVSGVLVHEFSSDLDLFLLWALAEYLAATRDLAFLDERLPFCPMSANVDGTVLEHAHAAFDHLLHRVRRGPHGLIRCGSGDWNDVLVAYSSWPLETILRGESALNAGLATVALPALAGAIKDADFEFAERLRAYAAEQAAALPQLWVGAHVARGFLGHGDETLGADRLFLDTQPFGVLGEVWDPAQTSALFDKIKRECVDPQPAGASALWPPMHGFLLDPGADTNGGTWAAIDSWLTWAWARYDRDEAWRFYLRTTLAAHADAYPNVWYGVWSGPDSYNADYHERPGETYCNAFTPMTDFPVMNMNRHSGPLLDAIKLAGIAPRDGIIFIDPVVPFDEFALRLPLIGAAYSPERAQGYYRPVATARFRFAARPPKGVDPSTLRLSVNQQTAQFGMDEDGLLRFSADGAPGDEIVWTIESSAR